MTRKIQQLLIGLILLAGAFAGARHIRHDVDKSSRASNAVNGAADTAPFGLVPPLKIVRSDMYLDGGSVMFEIQDATGRRLVGGFDGRMCAIQSGRAGEPSLDPCTPGRLYIGAEHPTLAGARLLPLCGDEERAVIRLLDSALDTELAPSEREFLRKSKSVVAGQVMLWYLVQRTASRQRFLACIDRGLLDCDDCLTGYLGVVNPIVIHAIDFVDSNATYVVTLADSSGTEFILSLPADSSHTNPSPSSMAFREEKAYTFPSDQGPTVWRSRSVMLNAFGSSGDRCALTVLMLTAQALDAEIAGADIADEMMAMVRWRARRTRETDSTR